MEDLGIPLIMREHPFRDVRLENEVFVLLTQNVILHYCKVTLLELKVFLIVSLEGWIVNSLSRLDYVGLEVFH